MSTRSRAHPWFAVDIEQRLVWSTPGGFICEHGTFIDPKPWSSSACFICDMEKAYGKSEFGGIPTGLATVEVRDGDVHITSAPPPPRQCEAIRDPLGKQERCENPAAWPSVYCPAHYGLEYQDCVEDVRYMVKMRESKKPMVTKKGVWVCPKCGSEVPWSITSTPPPTEETVAMLLRACESVHRSECAR